MNMTSRALYLGVAAVIIVAGAIALGMALESRVAQTNGAAQPSAKTAAAGQQAAPPISHMRLEAQYAGPLRDTLIQRWRDPSDGTICYIYLPIIVQHAAGPANLVQYGSNTIGSISCLPGH
jgi:hypothetical protein